MHTEQLLDRTGSAGGGPAMVVPFMDLRRTHEPLTSELSAVFRRVVGASGFILGDEVDRFEAEFANFCGVSHCVGVSSGTSALTLAMLAAGIGPGDEVIVPGHTFIASALAVIHTGATVVFCDVDDGTGLIDAEAAAAAIGPRTAAILAVHLYGQPAEMDDLAAIAAGRGLKLFEDAAQAHGATYRGAPVGSLADAAAFSFYPSKNLGALGDAGAICTDDAELAERARWLRHVGQRRKGEHVVVGFNARLDGMQAAFLRIKLRRLDAWNESRRRHADIYCEALPAELLLEHRPDSESAHHLFPIRVDDREWAVDGLARAGVQTAIHYFPSAADHPVWDGRASVRVEPIDAARRWAAHELSLPMFPELSADELSSVIAGCENLHYTKGRGA